MDTRTIRGSILALVLIAALASTLSWPQQASAPGTVPVNMIVTVEARKGKDVPTIYKEDVRVTHGQDRFRVSGWTPCLSDHTGPELFVLVDDATKADIGLQFADVKKFMEAQPPTAVMGVGYARNGTVEIIQNLTKDRALAEKALRLPMGATVMASPYLSISALVKGWPQSGNCREILMVSSGSDPLQPGPQNSYLQEAIDQSQRAAIQVYAIYAPRAGRGGLGGRGGGRGGFGGHHGGVNWGQNNLSQITEQTGGDFYIQGTTPPISYAPYLDEYAERLKHQFMLTFLAPAADKPGLQKVKLETEVSNAKLVAQEYVYIPAK
jgi:hypothetical protein